MSEELEQYGARQHAPIDLLQNIRAKVIPVSISLG